MKICKSDSSVVLFNVISLQEKETIIEELKSKVYEETAKD